MVAFITIGPMGVKSYLSTIDEQLIASMCYHLNGFLNALLYGVLSHSARHMGKASTRQRRVQAPANSYDTRFDPRVEVICFSAEETERRRQAESDTRNLKNTTLPGEDNESAGGGLFS